MSIAESVLAVFPPPSVLATGPAGIDITDGSVKCAVLAPRGSGARLSAYADTPLSAGAVIDGGIEIPERVVEVLRSIRLRQGIRSAAACLPEEKCFLYQALVPGNPAELRSAIEFDLETHVPLAPAEVAFDFEPMRSVEGGTVVSVTAYAKRIVDAYVSVFREAGITLSALEAEPQSIARAVLSAADRSRAVMVLDIGAHTTRIIIAEDGIVASTATISVGGDTFTAAISKFFNVSLSDAEKLRNERGFLVSSKNTEAVEAMITAVSVIRDETLKHLSYWDGLSADALPRKKVERIILSGGGANLSGLPEHLEGAAGIPVSLANAWANAGSLDSYVPPMPFQESLRYTAALGLAERGLT